MVTLPFFLAPIALYSTRPPNNPPTHYNHRKMTPSSYIVVATQLSIRLNFMDQFGLSIFISSSPTVSRLFWYNPFYSGDRIKRRSIQRRRHIEFCYMLSCLLIWQCMRSNDSNILFQNRYLPFALSSPTQRKKSVVNSSTLPNKTLLPRVEWSQAHTFHLLTLVPNSQYSTLSCLNGE